MAAHASIVSLGLNSFNGWPRLCLDCVYLSIGQFCCESSAFLGHAYGKKSCVDGIILGRPRRSVISATQA